MIEVLPVSRDLEPSPLQTWLEEELSGDDIAVDALLRVIEEAGLAADDVIGAASLKLMRGLAQAWKRFADGFPVIACGPLVGGESDDVVVFKIMVHGEADVLRVPLDMLKRHRAP